MLKFWHHSCTVVQIINASAKKCFAQLKHWLSTVLQLTFCHCPWRYESAFISREARVDAVPWKQILCIFIHNVENALHGQWRQRYPPYSTFAPWIKLPGPSRVMHPYQLCRKLMQTSAAASRAMLLEPPASCLCLDYWKLTRSWRGEHKHRGCASWLDRTKQREHSL